VRWIAKTCALLLLVLWVPVSMHCELEALGGLEFLSCCSHTPSAPHQDNDCQEDACSVVESGAFFLPQKEREVTPPVALLEQMPLDLVEPLTASAPGLLAPTSETPLGLSRLWRFSERTALPPRAPSLLS
jgi:hypothetical protein